jgi:mono/diheme cytochrome c family protein
MNRELRYIFKGVFYACVLFAVVYAGYYLISYEKNKAAQRKPPVITHEDLLKIPEVAEGKILFNENCSACHKLHFTEERWLGISVQNDYEKKELYGWIRNSDSVIKSGNKYYNELFNAYNKTRMTSFPNLTDKQIEEIIDYIKVEEAFK